MITWERTIKITMVSVIIHCSITNELVRSQSSCCRVVSATSHNSLCLDSVFSLFPSWKARDFIELGNLPPFLIRHFLSLPFLQERGDSSHLDCYLRRSDAWSEIPASAQTSNVSFNVSLCLFAPQFLHGSRGIRALPHPWGLGCGVLQGHGDI